MKAIYGKRKEIFNKNDWVLKEIINLTYKIIPNYRIMGPFK